MSQMIEIRVPFQGPARTFARRLSVAIYQAQERARINREMSELESLPDHRRTDMGIPDRTFYRRFAAEHRWSPRDPSGW